MKYNRLIILLVLCIVVLSLFASVIGIFYNTGPEACEIESFKGETIYIHGGGLYSEDSISIVAQGKAQDIVTLGYFLYTYISYVFYGCTIKCLLYM